MARVIRTTEARNDLKGIGRYIAERSQNRSIALRFLDNIDKKCRLFATQPEMGEPRPVLRPDVRSFPVDNYVVIYRPLQDGILVLLVTHGSRDIPRLFRRRV